MKVHRYYHNIEFITQTESQIERYFIRNKSKFIDLDFPPVDESIEKTRKEIIENYECLVHWRRIEDIVKDPKDKEIKPILYHQGINPNDVT